jgi:excisionase family DNA binding protein
MPDPVNELRKLPPVLTVEEAAKILRISRGSAYESVRAGGIPSIRIGRTIRVPTHALLSMLGEPAAESHPNGHAHPDDPGGRTQHSQEGERESDGRVRGGS